MTDEFINTVTYKPGWVLDITPDGSKLRWLWSAPCSVEGLRKLQSSRWWYIKDMTEEEVVKTAFLAVKVAEEHELLEFFKYKGVMLFNPHTPLAALAAAQG